MNKLLTILLIFAASATFAQVRDTVAVGQYAISTLGTNDYVKLIDVPTVITSKYGVLKADEVVYVPSTASKDTIYTLMNARTAGKKRAVLLERGSIINTSLVIPDDSLIIASYGSGEKPVISGFTEVTGWTDEGGGIYSKVITSESQTNMVTVNGKNQGMGRFPNAGQSYLTYESFSTTVSITDNQLTNSPNWTGAELIKRANDWTWQRCSITNHTNTVITYTDLSGALYGGVNGNGYFFQNALQTLDTLGEWYHDTSNGKFYMYFGAEDPTDYVVKVATLDNLVTNAGNDHITFKNLQFEGSIDNTIDETAQSHNMIVQNCTFKNSGSYGLYVDSYSSLVDNNTFEDCNQGAIRGADSLITITNNNINRIGLIIGSSKLYYNAILASVNDGGLIQYNTIDSSGAVGIHFAGNDVLVKNNFVNYSCLVINDFGGIYTTEGTGLSDAVVNAGSVIDGNIILNTIGNKTGTNTAAIGVHGIYLDNQSHFVTVTNNTTALNGFAGIHLNRANDCRIENNIAFGNVIVGINAQNDVPTENYLFNDTIRYNQLIAKSGQFAINLRELNLSITSPAGVGLLDYNVYTRPINDNKITISTYGGSYAEKTLAEWKTFTTMEANSTKSPQVVTSDNDYQFEYNATKTAKTVTFTGSKIDVEGNVYTGSVTLQPYTSVVLMPYYLFAGNTIKYSLISNSTAKRAYPVTVSEDGSIEAISLYHNARNAATDSLMVAVYSDNTGSPSSRLGISARSTQISATEGWQTVNLISPVAVTAGQTIWLAWQLNSATTIGVFYDAGAVTRASTTATYPALADPFGATSFANFSYSVYAKYANQ